MRRALFLLSVAVPALLATAARAADAGASGADEIKLERVSTNSARPGEQRLPGARLADRPAAEGARLKLPPTIINIEDRSEMRLARDLERRSLIPELDRRTNERDKPFGSRPEDTVPRERREPRQAASAFELLYGSYDALSASLSTGREYRHAFYQASYVRKRDEGFSLGAGRVPNSVTGLDDLRVDAGYGRDALDAVLGLRFLEEQAGLQANTNWAQLRKSGLWVSGRASLISGPMSSLRAELEVGRGRFVLDAPGGQAGLETFGLRLGLGWTFGLAPALSAQLGLAMRYEHGDASYAAGGEIRDGELSAGLVLNLGDGASVAAGSALVLVDLARLEAAPYLRGEARFGRALSVFAELAREVTRLDFNLGALGASYALWAPGADPQLGWRLGGGLRLRVVDDFILVGRVERRDYALYYAASATADGLYGWTARAAAWTQVQAEAYLGLAPGLAVRGETTWRLVAGNAIPYLPALAAKAVLEWTPAGWGSTALVTADFRGSRETAAGATLDGYLLVHASWRQELSDHLALAFELRNLLDARYRVREAYAEPGFTAHAGLSLRF